MNITQVKHCSITRYEGTDAEVTITGVVVIATIDGKTVYVPTDPDNRHYAEILKQVEAGTLTIEEAD